MTLLDESTVSSRADAPTDERCPPDHAPDQTTGDDATIDLTGETAEVERTEPVHSPDPAPSPAASPFVDPSGRLPLRGMRIRRVRLGSVALIASVFWALGFLVTVGTLVAVWNVAQSLGFVTDIEDALITSLGLESFQIEGGGLFEVVAIGAGIIAVLGWLLTVLLAAVYNATCALFGGLAVETGPLQRRQRVFSLRHRGFVTIRA